MDYLKAEFLMTVFDFSVLYINKNVRGILNSKIKLKEVIFSVSENHKMLPITTIFGVGFTPQSCAAKNTCF